jgi:hypothetical protein
MAVINEANCVLDSCNRLMHPFGASGSAAFRRFLYIPKIQHTEY